MSHVDGTLAGTRATTFGTRATTSRRGDTRLRVLASVLGLVIAACSAGSETESPGETVSTPSSPSSPPTSVLSVTPSTTQAEPTTVVTTLIESASADEVVTGFYGSWNAGDITSALAVTSDDVRSSWGAGEALVERMGFAHALGQTRSPSDCVVAANGPSSIVTCTVSVSGPLADELAIDPPRERHLVTDGRIVNITFSPAYAPTERALAAAALENDSAGFEQACSTPADVDAMPYTAGCGAFLSGFSTAATERLADMLPDAAADPREVVAGFYQSWNRGDVTAAASYLSPDVVSEVGSEPGLGYHRLRNFMDFVAALSFAVRVEDCELLGSATNPAIVRCFVAYESELFDAMEISGARVPHKVANGVLVSVNVGAQYAVAEKALADFIASAQPDEFASICTDPEKGAGLTYSEFGFTYNAPCGAFAARFLSDAVSSISAG